MDLWHHPFMRLGHFSGFVAEIRPPAHYIPKTSGYLFWFDMKEDIVWRYDLHRKLWTMEMITASRSYGICNLIRQIAGYGDYITTSVSPIAKEKGT
jgi:hypothetical protein